MKIEIIHTSEITSYVGVRASSFMSHLGHAVRQAFDEIR